MLLPPKTISDLPSELVGHIADHLPKKKGLEQLALTSKLLRSCCFPVRHPLATLSCIPFDLPIGLTIIRRLCIGRSPMGHGSGTSYSTSPQRQIHFPLGVAMSEYLSSELGAAQLSSRIYTTYFLYSSV